MMSVLVNAEIDGQRLDDEDLLQEGLLILVGGDETTRHVITGGVYSVQFQLSSALVTDLATQATIAQQAFVSNVVTFAVAAAPSYLTNAASATSSSTSAKPASSAPPA